MPQLPPRRLVLPVTELVGTMLLHDCSQASSDIATDSALAFALSLTPTKHTTGTAANFLNGIRSHTGEPLRNFPGLLLLKKENDRGMWVYQMSAFQERGLFGKHAKHSTICHQFQDSQFAMLEAVTTGTGASSMAVCQEALFLAHGPGKDRHDLIGGLDWKGPTGDILRKTGASGTVLAVSVQQDAAASAAGQGACATAGG